MLGGEAPTDGTSPEGGNTALVEACRDVRERLETIARALGALREEIDRTLREGHALSDEGRPSG